MSVCVYDSRMLLLVRRLKYDQFMKDSYRKYAAYAFGELLLVVVGILIALQIDNWNEDRKERATLQSYAESIARNIREDLAELEPLRAHRLKALSTASAFGSAVYGREDFDVNEIFFVNQMLELSTSETFFSANTSGFEALKNSGVLDRLQGSGVERLLFAYYDTVNQIGLLETSLYNKVRPISIELNRDRPQELASYALNNPIAVPPDQFRAIQPFFRRFINSPMMLALSESQYANHLLMLHYDSLQVLGQALVQAVETRQLNATNVMPRTPINSWRANQGLPTIVSNGRPALEAYGLVTTLPPSTEALPDFDVVQMRENELHIDYPGGAEWASIYFVAMNVSTGRSFMDLSEFTRLALELKGERGGEVLRVHIKDADYPDDRPPISVDLTLSNEWQQYDIDLAEFVPSDLTKLHVVLGFLIAPARDPLAFSVRNARYLGAE